MSNTPIETPVPTIPVYDAQEAKARGFKAISNRVNARIEPETFLSMESTLKGCLSCWIRVAPDIYQAARAKDEIWKD